MDLYREVEDNIISNILATTKYQDCIFNELEAKHFLTVNARTVYEQAKSIYLAGELVDNVFVTASLQNTGGWTPMLNDYITDTVMGYVTGANYEYYIKQIKANYINSLVSVAKNQEDFNKIQEEVEKNQATTKISHISEGKDKFLENYSEQYEAAISFDIKCVQDIIGFLAKGDYFFLSALTGGGKSVFAMNLAHSAALQGKKVLYVNLEMTVQQLQNRLIGKIGQIDTSKYRRLEFTQVELDTYELKLNELENLPIFVASPYNCTPTELKSLIHKTNPDMVIIDYLGLMASEVATRGDTERISYLSRKIKNLALYFKIPFVVLHQLNRDYKDRQEKRPKISDIKNSSQIEQDADFVNFLHRPSLFDDEEPQQLLEFINAKNRHGKPNQIGNIRFIEEYQTMEDWS